MKRFLGILGVVIFFLFIMGAILFKLFASDTTETSGTVPTSTAFPIVTQADNSESSPEAFTESFYAWYLENFSRDSFFPAPEYRNQLLSPWVSSSLLADWDQIVSDIEVNPVLLTADDPLEWGSGISATTLSQAGDYSTVQLTLGSGATAHSYEVQLSKGSDRNWRISTVTAL